MGVKVTKAQNNQYFERAKSKWSEFIGVGNVFELLNLIRL